MDIINTLKEANIFSHEDISVFENHSLNNNYNIYDYENYNFDDDYAYEYEKCNKVTILMLLIDLLNKYPASLHIINNIIITYIKKVPEDIYKINGCNDSALYMCIRGSHIETIKVLLNNGVNINHIYDDEDKRTAVFFTSWLNFDIVKFLVDYDANCHINDKYRDNGLNYYKTYYKGKMKRIVRNVTILNKKN